MKAILVKNIQTEVVDVPGSKMEIETPDGGYYGRTTLMMWERVGDEKISTYFVKEDEMGLFQNLIKVSKKCVEMGKETASLLEWARIRELPWWKRLFKLF